MASTNLDHTKSLYVDEHREFSVKEDTSEYQIGPDELLIETIFSGVNPADVKHATLLGIYPAVLGYDFCGRVLAAPPDSKFSENDLVAGLTPSGLGRPARYGTHQRRLACPQDMAFKVPDNLPPSHAAALSVSALVAADAVFNYFKFPLPGRGRDSLADSQRPVLIWGASTTAGLCAVQFARASGCRNILVTASPARHDMLKGLGATHAFDYRSPDVVAEILAVVGALGQGPIRHAFDAICATGPASSSAKVAQCAEDPSAVLLAVIFINDDRFATPFSLARDDWVIRINNQQTPTVVPARPEDYQKSWEALEWAVANYGEGFQLPVVQVIEGSAEKVLQEVIKVGDGVSGFGKWVVSHPLY